MTPLNTQNDKAEQHIDHAYTGEDFERRIERNLKWAAKFGEQSPIRVNEIDPMTDMLRAAAAQARKLIAAEARVAELEEELSMWRARNYPNLDLRV